MKKSTISHEVEQFENNIKLIRLALSAGQSHKMISVEDSALYASASQYYTLTQEDKLSKKAIDLARGKLISALEMDSKNWFFNRQLNKPLQTYLPTLLTNSTPPLTPAIIISIGIAYDQDEKAATALFQILCKSQAVLDIRLNIEGDNLLHIAARGNYVQLLKLMIEHKVFSIKQLGAPNSNGQNPEYLATISGNDAIVDTIKNATPKAKVSDNRYSSTYKKTTSLTPRKTDDYQLLDLNL